MGFQEKFSKAASITRSLEFLRRLRHHGQVEFHLSFSPSRRAKLEIFEGVGVSHFAFIQLGV